MSSARTPQEKPKMDKGHLNPTPMVKARGPWIAAGKASVQDASYKWEGPTCCLEVTPPLPEGEPEHSHSALRLTDLTSGEEEGLHRRIGQYEKRVVNLLSEVSSLRNEVELCKKEQLSVSQRVIAKHEEELAEVTRELKDTEWENMQLHDCMEKMLEETYYTRQDSGLQQSKDVLLRKIREVEVNGSAGAKQTSALRESVHKLCDASSSRLFASESSRLTRQKELLQKKLETFEATNQTLRHLLREQHGSQMESVHLSEQKDTLLKILVETEAQNAHLMVKLQEKEKEVKQLVKVLDTEKGNNRNTADLSKSLESTRAHLQRQLRCKEAESNQLTVQTKNLKRAAQQQKAVKDHLEEQLTRMKGQTSTDRESEKRAARVQKQRAEHSEDTVGQLSFQLKDMEKQVTHALSAAETWQNRCSHEMKDKSKLEVELSLLNCHIAELTEQLQSTEEKGRLEREALLAHLYGLTTESTAAKLENQSLKAKLPSVEQKLALSQSEHQQVKASVKQYESLLDSYSVQVLDTRAEATECGTQLAWAEREAQAVRVELEQEVEEARRELLGQLAELEPLPEALQCSEQQLQDAQNREHSLERRSIELSTTLTDLRFKVETQMTQLDLFRQRNKVLLQKNRQLQHEVESLEKKMEEAATENTNMLTVIVTQEDTIHRNQLHLEEKTGECSTLSRKLEQALDDARQQMSETREHVFTKEHYIQSKILGLETQLSRTTSEINQLRCNKDEMEQRYRIRLQDVKDLLEKSYSTNRSLQNYVQFLKASYSTVFEDVALSTSLQAL